MIDRDRSALYAAEIAAFDGTDLERTTTLEIVLAAIAAVCDSPWWPGPPVKVRAARSDAVTSTTRCTGDATTISIAAAQATIATAAHELGHVLAGVDHGHDARFRAAYLDVVAVITNVDPIDRRGTLHVEQLAEAFARFGLAVAVRDWPAPPSVGAISL